MSVAPAITWLLVSTSPDEVITIPVPAAAPLVSVVLMSTTPGSTFAAIAATSIPPRPTGAANAGVPKRGPDERRRHHERTNA